MIHEHYVKHLREWTRNRGHVAESRPRELFTAIARFARTRQRLHTHTRATPPEINSVRKFILVWSLWSRLDAPTNGMRRGNTSVSASILPFIRHPAFISRDNWPSDRVKKQSPPARGHVLTKLLWLSDSCSEDLIRRQCRF